MNPTSTARHGGCHCGEIRYRVTGATVLVEYCHCKSCRAAVGAPLLAWAAFDCGGFEITHGEPVAYRSSDTVVRTFCGRCGTSLTLADERFDKEIYVSVTSFDEPEAVPPEFHIWRGHRLSWLETTDDLPRYVQFKADGVLEIGT